LGGKKRKLVGRALLTGKGVPGLEGGGRRRGTLPEEDLIGMGGAQELR